MLLRRPALAGMAFAARRSGHHSEIFARRDETAQLLARSPRLFDHHEAR